MELYKLGLHLAKNSKKHDLCESNVYMISLKKSCRRGVVENKIAQSVYVGCAILFFCSYL